MSVVILGALASVVLHFAVRQNARSEHISLQALKSRAARTLVVFAQVNGRLPCVGNDQGVEDCASGSTSGGLPYVTLGLPEPGAKSLRYELAHSAFSSPDSGAYSLVEATAPGPTMVAKRAFLPNSHKGLNFCEALTSTDGEAFSLRVQTPAFKTKDVAQAMGTMSLADELACSDRSALLGRAYPNVALAAASTAASIADWRRQLEINKAMMDWDAGQSVWFTINSTISMVKPVLKFHQGAAAFARDDATDPSKMINPIMQAPFIAGVLAAITSNTARYLFHIIVGKQNLQQIGQMEVDVNALNARFQQNAQIASSDFLAIDAQLSPPSKLKEPEAVGPLYLAKGGNVAQNNRDYIDALGKFYPIPGVTDFWQSVIKESNFPAPLSPSASTSSSSPSPSSTPSATIAPYSWRDMEAAQ